MCLLAVFCTAACRDALTDPLVDVVAEESAAALALGVSVADPVLLVEEDGGTLDEQGMLALEAWRASWSQNVAAGRETREPVYGSLAAGLADIVEPEAVARETALLEESVRRARGIEVEGLLPLSLTAGIEAAASYHAAAVAALDRGDAMGAIEDLLRGGDALREIGPEAVARALSAEVTSSLGRIPEDGPYSERDLERVRRLVSGSHEAVGNGEWVLAIRRAYYARALLEGHGG